MARDIFHYLVKEALVKEGWLITHDPYPLHSRKEGGLQTDLGAEKIITAERNNIRIAVEVKSFVHISIMHDFLLAVGQFFVYKKILEKNEPDRTLYIALPEFIYSKVSKLDWAKEVIQELDMKFILYDSSQKIITAWET